MNSATVQGMLKVRSGEADGFVSAGSTGATLAGGMFRLGRIPGIERRHDAVHATSRSYDKEQQQEGADGHYQALYRISGHYGLEASYRCVYHDDRSEQEKPRPVRKSGHALQERSSADELCDHLRGKEHDHRDTAYDHDSRRIIARPEIIVYRHGVCPSGYESKLFAQHTKGQKGGAYLHPGYPGP